MKHLSFGRSFQIFAKTVIPILAAILFSFGNNFNTPNVGLDPGWQEALVQATDNNLIFGKDIIFTYGPLHQLVTNQLSENLNSFILGRILYGICWFLTTLLLEKIFNKTAVLAYITTMFITTSNFNDAQIYCLFINILICSFFVPRDRSSALVIYGASAMSCSLFLAKLSYAVIGIPALVGSLYFSPTLISRKPTITTSSPLSINSIYIEKALVAAFYFIIFSIFWISTGQKIEYLPEFVAGGNLDIIFGYSSAMSHAYPQANWQITAYWVSVFLLLSNIIFFFGSQNQRTKYILRGKQFFFILSLLYWFWSVFKVGMVRHGGHAQISGFALIGACSLLLILFNRLQVNKYAIPTTIISFSLGLSIVGQFRTPVRTHLIKHLRDSFENSNTFFKIMANKDFERKIISKRLGKLEELKSTSEVFTQITKNGTVDAIPWDITDLVVGGLNYSPRPIIQSYSAYTEKLQKINYNHYFNIKTRPEYVILKAIAIDGRIEPDQDYPLLDIIRNNYKLVGEGNKGSLIFKATNDNSTKKSYKFISKSSPKLKYEFKKAKFTFSNSSTLNINNLEYGSLISVECKLNPFEKLSSFIYKPPEFYLEVAISESQNDEARFQKTYRFLCNSSRFIPIINNYNTQGFRDYLTKEERVSRLDLKLTLKEDSVYKGTGSYDGHITISE